LKRSLSTKNYFRQTGLPLIAAQPIPWDIAGVGCAVIFVACWEKGKKKGSR